MPCAQCMIDPGCYCWMCGDGLMFDGLRLDVAWRFMRLGKSVDCHWIFVRFGISNTVSWGTLGQLSIVLEYTHTIGQNGNLQSNSAIHHADRDMPCRVEARKVCTYISGELGVFICFQMKKQLKIQLASSHSWMII